MKIVFFGLGSIGKRHANILIKNYSCELFAFRSTINKKDNDLGIEEIYTWQDLKKIKPDVAFITNPTSEHTKTAIECAKLGIKLFIEKPIDKDTKNLEKLIEIVKRKKLVTYIAYNMRFHPVINEIKNYLSRHKPLHLRVVCTSFYPLWRPGYNHLKVYTAKAKQGGGVILDLSHELDYVTFFLGPINIRGSFSKRSNVTVDAEDYADFLIESKIAPANIHINFFSQILQRYIQVDFANLTIIGDLINSEIVEYKNQKLSKRIKLKNYRDLSYEKQIKYFFDNINNTRMMNNLIEASNMFKKVISFKNE